MKLSDLEDAFLFVGSVAPCEHTALICPQTDQVCLRSEMGELDEIPEEAFESDAWHEIPHKRDLGLGRDLVLEFVSRKLPADLDRVQRIFSRPGAYANYKDLLDERGVIEEWYAYENACLRDAILEWCRDEGIEVRDDTLQQKPSLPRTGFPISPLQVAEAFVAAINSGEPKRMAALMTPEHTFIDADGSEHAGKDHMTTGWQEYFDMVPDFRIEVSDRFEDKDTVVLLGRASGTFVQDGELKPENQWRVPAAWRVVVDADLVAVWQLYANQHMMNEIWDRIRAS